MKITLELVKSVAIGIAFLLIIAVFGIFIVDDTYTLYEL